MSKMWNWKFVIKGLASVLLGFIVVVLPFTLWDAWISPQEYPFGTEGPVAGSWAYESQSNYMVGTTITWLCSALALWALFATKRSLRLRWFCAAPFLVDWGVSALNSARMLF